jgi:hypothetical protein
MLNHPYISTPGLQSVDRQRNPVAVAWDITGPDDTSNPLLKDGDYGIWLPTGTPLLPEARPIVYRFKKDVPYSPFIGGGTTNLWLPPNVYDANPTIMAWLTGTESFMDLMAQGWSPAPTGVGATIGSVGGRIRLESPTLTDQVRLICANAILFSEEFYFRGEVRGQYALNNTVEAGLFHVLPPITVPPTQYALGKITTQNNIYNLVRGAGTWSVFPAAATNKAGVVFEPNNTWNMEVNSYDRISTSTRLLCSTTINGVPYSTARRGTSASVASDPFNLEIRVTSGVVGTPTRIELKNFYVLKY